MSDQKPTPFDPTEPRFTNPALPIRDDPPSGGQQSLPVSLSVVGAARETDEAPERTDSVEHSSRLGRLAVLERRRVAKAAARSTEAPGYGQLVSSAATTSIGLLVLKAAAVFGVAQLVGAATEIRTFLVVLPYFAFETTTQYFMTIVTFSTIAMAAGAATALLPSAIGRRRARQVVWGRGIGLALALETVLFEIIRHEVFSPVIRTEWIWLAFFQIAAGVVLLGIALKRSLTVAEVTAERAWGHVETSSV